MNFCNASTLSCADRRVGTAIDARPLIDLAAYGLGRVSCFHFSFSRLEFRLFEG